MAVTEALMALFAKELVPAPRVAAAVERMERAGLLAKGGKAPAAAPEDSEEALLGWADAACRALAKTAAEEDDGVRKLSF